MYLAWISTTPHNWLTVLFVLYTCSFQLSPWIGLEVPSKAITLTRPWREEKGSLGVNCINKLLVKLFKLALRTANDPTKHTHTPTTCIYSGEPQFAVHKIATVYLQTE